MSITVRKSIIITLGDKAEIVIEESMLDGYKIDINCHVREKLWVGVPHRAGGEKHYPFWNDVVDAYCKEQNKADGLDV